jgi:hypothetical protein
MNISISQLMITFLNTMFSLTTNTNFSIKLSQRQTSVSFFKCVSLLTTSEISINSILSVQFARFCQITACADSVTYF